MCCSEQVPTLTASAGVALVVVPSMFQPVKWLWTEPSEVSTNWSPATIGAVDEAFGNNDTTL